jgi:tRNA pseudouridine38-40 synthase
MPRYRLTIEYDGAAFVGWQTQANGVAVQALLEAAAANLVGGEAVTIFAAGRTDSGVHALGQVAHVDLAKQLDPLMVLKSLNFFLRPNAIAVTEVAIVPDDFHARFSAKKRHYRYRILNRSAVPAIDRNRVWHVYAPLDLAAMQDAAQVLVGNHDFTSFRAAACQAKSPVKTLDYLTVSRDGDEVIVETGARSFLHNQVRAMTGSLKLVGEGRWTRADIQTALDARDRAYAGPNAPAEGLYFVRVDY